MNFVSTRGGANPVSLSDAIRRGAAPDGGLYCPTAIPRCDVASAAGLALPDFAARFLAPYFAGDRLEPLLGEICAESLAIDTPLASPDPHQAGLFALELFHGPTGAFKDFGARFLMACYDRRADGDEPLSVLAATSGDTGGAVGCAAEGRGGLSTVILYPEGRVSPFQERQLTCWSAPVRALRVAGDFDDCQRLVKAAFANEALTAKHGLTSANSINLGRLLPQAAYLAHAVHRLHARTGVEPGLVIPTGNLGHGFAALLARASGAPLGPLVLATNANRTLTEWDRTGEYRPRPSLATIANAMDVGAPSNFERLIDLPADLRALRVDHVEDETIRARIVGDFERSGYLWCPHSAVAAETYARLSDAERAGRPWIIAATAHPYKFSDVIEPLIGQSIAPPPALAAILERPTESRRIDASLQSLSAAL
ncbi:threonine synthase [Sphingomonas rhizophila]|uniref:Threonine synthase n=1 Tax=Sphingomonas rhizophila TaxID=2071607 RepID=A0A7G9SA48_9SPHN|nr:threonine synthase [Sphingomonas rhizophila]QNN64723.1 threonine synthase [Sphingomonas rhizophila]